MKFVKYLLVPIALVLFGVFLTLKFDSSNNGSSNSGYLSKSSRIKNNSSFENNLVNDSDYKYAQYSVNKDSKNDKHSRFAYIAKDNIKKVVNIKTERSIEYNYTSPFDRFFNNDPFFDRFHGGDSPQKQKKSRKQIQRAEGSGFIYSEDGYIMTNNHVVDKADKITVKLSNGDEFIATVIGTDPETDLAVIKVDHEFGKEFVTILGNSDDLWVGDWVIAIGSPYSLEKTVTVGIVSAKDRAGLGLSKELQFQDFIQTDAAINPGNSGGPLLDVDGKVIGINAAINARAQGIGFAIPINLAKKIEKQLRNDGEVKRGFIGIGLKDIVNEEKGPYGIEKGDTAILITSVGEGTPAQNSGLLPDDIIILLNDKKLLNYENFRFKIASFSPGDEITLSVLRMGEKKEFSVILGDRSELLGISSNKNNKIIPDEEQEVVKSIQGVELKELTDTLKEKFQINKKMKGILVTDVKEESKFTNVLIKNDIIQKLIYSGYQYNIESIDTFENYMDKIIDSKRAFIIVYLRNGVRQSAVVR